MLSVVPTRQHQIASIARTFGKSPEVSSSRRVLSALMFPDGSTTFCSLEILDQAIHLDLDRRQLAGVELQPDADVRPARRAARPSRIPGELGRASCVNFSATSFKSQGCEKPSPDRNGRDRDVAEVAVDEGADDAVGQFDLDAAHLVAQPLPSGIDVADLVLQVDVDRQRAFAGERPGCP